MRQRSVWGARPTRDDELAVAYQQLVDVVAAYQKLRAARKWLELFLWLGVVALAVCLSTGCTPELPTSPSRIAEALGCPEDQVVPAQRTGTQGQWYVCAGSQEMPAPPAPGAGQ